MPTSSLDWRLQYAIDYFAKQHEAMHRLKDRINFLAALLFTPIASAIFFVYSSRKDLPSNLVLDVGALGCLLIASVLLLYSGFHIFLSLSKAHEYSYPQQPSELSQYYKQLPQDESALQTLKEEMLSAYEKIISETKSTNDKRNKLIIDAQRFAAYSLPFLLLSASITFAQSTFAPDKTPEVIIKNALTVKSEASNDKIQPAAEQAKPTAVATCTCNTPPIYTSCPKANVPQPRETSRPCRTDSQ